MPVYQDRSSSPTSCDWRPQPATCDEQDHRSTVYQRDAANNGADHQLYAFVRRYAHEVTRPYAICADMGNSTVPFAAT
jgi:hypothetical protein